MANTKKDNLNKLIENYKNLASEAKSIEAEALYRSKEREAIERYIVELKKEYLDLSDTNTKQAKDLLDIINSQEIELSNVVRRQEQINNSLKTEINRRKLLLDSVKSMSSVVRGTLDYLMQSDKVIKSTILNLGLSGTKANMMRTSFEGSAQIVARLGGTLEDIQSVMEGYANETGRARALSGQMVEDIVTMGKGTGMGVEKATKLASQFEIIGMNARGALNYAQGVVDTSERMGVNTTKVFDNISDNFKKLNTFTFRQGVKGMAEMATYAEKFNIDITSALNSAEIARSLEGAVDLAANLQVMGGEFAKTDPFEMLFLSRNDPAQFTKKISEMTRGIVSFRKNSEGAFEKFISPADRDRLANVAKSLNMSVEEVTQIAQRRAEIDKMSQDMMGMGLTPREKELIEGAAIFNQQSGRFQVMLGDTLTDLTNLTGQQAKSFAKEQVLLSDRAKEAQTFDEMFKNTINEFKSMLLPLLRNVNDILMNIRPFVEGLTDFASKFHPGVLLTAALALKGAFYAGNEFAKKLLDKRFENIINRSGGVLGGGGAPGNRNISPGTLTQGSTSGLVEQRRGIGRGALAKGQGIKAAGIGAGVGVAAAGIGVGINLGAEGFAKLSKAVKDLDIKKIKELNNTMMILGGTIALTLVPASFALAGAGTAAAPALLAFGAAAVGIGFGINLAATGIGKMSEGLGTLVEKSKGAGSDLLKVAGGIAGIAASLNLFTIGTLGLPAFAATMGLIAATAPSMTNVGAAFEKMGVAVDKIIQLKGTKDDLIELKNMLESISNMNVSKNNALSQLSELLNKPLKVEFADNKMSLINDITLNIDGEKFMKKIYRPDIAIERNKEAQRGHYV